MVAQMANTTVIKKILASKRLTKIFLSLLVLLVGILISTLSLLFFLRNRIYPGIFIAETNISFKQQYEAQNRIEERLSQRGNTTLVFSFATSSGQLKNYPLNLLNSIGKTNISEVINNSFQLGHKKLFLPPVQLSLDLTFSPSLDEKIKSISREVNIPVVSAKIKIEDSNILVIPSQEGLSLDENKLKGILIKYFNSGKLENQTLPVVKIYPNFNTEAALTIKTRLEEIQKNPLKLKYKDKTFFINAQDVLSLIDFGDEKLSPVFTQLAFAGDTQTYEAMRLAPDKLRQYMKKISTRVERPVVEPIFELDPISSTEKPRIKNFVPPQEGLKLNLEKTQVELTKAILTKIDTIELSIEIEKPKNKLVNDLGIKELLGRGVSYFRGSIENRIFNIRYTASKINGIIVAPGEVFSFNSAVGDISADSGFKQAYVIKSGRTVLDDGGGVCQDSTTLFRAVLNAGLPVIKRTAHAYRVGYYEQGFSPGLDATVFSPSVDFQFKNDTGAHILIQAYTYGNALTVDLYGTSDERLSTLSSSVITEVSPPPDPLYQDDPTLPKGEVKQVDWPAWGAKVRFSRKVTRGGQVLISETYTSNYKPWQAVYLVGTQ